ncbi:hypothetical protein FB451DRAFT_1177175 [Mycena latifolia]|nr:hypothetical protein FB451DRAFT_1177175 [Mycena latifolia]
MGVSRDVLRVLRKLEVGREVASINISEELLDRRKIDGFHKRGTTKIAPDEIEIQTIATLTRRKQQKNIGAQRKQDYRAHAGFTPLFAESGERSRESRSDVSSADDNATTLQEYSEKRGDRANKFGTELKVFGAAALSGRKSDAKIQSPVEDEPCQVQWNPSKHIGMEWILKAASLRFEEDGISGFCAASRQSTTPDLQNVTTQLQFKYCYD